MTDSIDAFLDSAPMQIDIGKQPDAIDSFLNSQSPVDAAASDARAQNSDIVKSVGSGLGRGIQYAIDLPAAALATGVEKLTGDKTPAKKLFQNNMGNGLNAGTTAVLGPEYQPKTTLGKLAKSGSMTISTLPLGGAGALEEGLATAAGRSFASGVGSDLAGQAGGNIGQAVGGDTGKTVGTVLGAIAGGGAGAYSPEITLATGAKAANTVKNVATNVAEGSSNIKAGFGRQTAEQWSHVGTDMSDRALETLKAADKNGTIIAAPAVSEGVQSVIDEVKASKDLAGTASNELYPKTKAFLADLSTYSGKDMSLEQAHQLRQTGSALISKAFRSGDSQDAYLLNDTLGKMDEWIGKIGVDGLKTGSPENIKTFQDFLGEYSQFKRFDKVQKILEFSHGDISKVRQDIQKWFKPGAEKKLSGFTSDQVAQLKSFAFPGKGEQVLNAVGKFGVNVDKYDKTTIGPAVADSLLAIAAGAHVGGGALVAGTLAKTAANRIAQGKLEKTLTNLAGGKPLRINIGKTK